MTCPKCKKRVNVPPEYTVPAMQHIPERDVYRCPHCDDIFYKVTNAENRD